MEPMLTVILGGASGQVNPTPQCDSGDMRTSLVQPTFAVALVPSAAKASRRVRFIANACKRESCDPAQSEVGTSETETFESHPWISVGNSPSIQQRFEGHLSFITRTRDSAIGKTSRIKNDFGRPLFPLMAAIEERG